MTGNSDDRRLSIVSVREWHFSGSPVVSQGWWKFGRRCKLLNGTNNQLGGHVVAEMGLGHEEPYTERPALAIAGG